jgi:MFS family permease
MQPTPVESTAEKSSDIRDRRPQIALYLLATFLYWACLYLYAPTLPTYAESRTGSLSMVGVILAQYGLWQAIIRLPLGIAADWSGRRKPFILVGLILAGLGAWVLGSADSALELSIGRAITGLGAGTWVILLTAFGSLFPAGEAVRATAILSAVGSVGRLSATSVTGSLNLAGGYSLAFYGATILAGLSALLILPTREKVHPQRRLSAAGIGRLITRREVLLPALLAAVLQYVVWAVTFGFVPILAGRLGASDTGQSMLMSLHVGLVAVASFGAAAVVKRAGEMRLVYATFLLLVTGTAATAAATSLAVIFLAQVLLGLARGLGYPVLMGMSVQGVDDVQRTTAMGLHQSVYAVGMFCGPWISGILADGVGIRPMLGITATACLVVSLFIIRRIPKYDGQVQGLTNHVGI